MNPLSRLWIVVMAVLLLAIAASLSCRQAHARWSPAYASQAADVQAWFKQQHNSRGEWCCDETDGHPYFGDWAYTNDGGVVVELNGEPHIIDKAMVLTGKNPTGHAVWWYRDSFSGHRDYCFAPGVLG